MRYGDSCLITTMPYFLMWNHGSVSWRPPWNGTFRSTYDPVCDRYGWNEDPLGFRAFPFPQISSVPVYFLSCILDRYHFTSGGVLLFRPQESTQDETACIINVLSALGS